LPDDKNNVVKLRQPAVASKGATAAGVSVDDVINPKSLLNMTDVETGRIPAATPRTAYACCRSAACCSQNRARAESITAMVKLERKADQVEKQLEKATKALDKLEELIYALRALNLQHTDVDITQTET
jgi:hypothetical protein